jgi:hypothetical protein
MASVPANQVNLPGPDKRLAIVGSTGSGKTQAGIWHLSNQDWGDKVRGRPWIIFDFKGDDLIARLGATEISVYGKPPTKPGLYVVRPIPEMDDAAVTQMLWNIWRNENTGIYIDEGYMVGNRNPALNACLTQGRSKRIQMIVLSQRPVWMSRFVFSEADFFQVFRLNDRRDYDNVQSMISIDVTKRLAPYQSHWYDVGADRGVIFNPVPGRRSLIESFRSRSGRNIRAV